jgi:hypothetical protein
VSRRLPQRLPPSADGLDLGVATGFTVATMVPLNITVGGRGTGPAGAALRHLQLCARRSCVRYRGLSSDLGDSGEPGLLGRCAHSAWRLGPFRWPSSARPLAVRWRSGTRRRCGTGTREARHLSHADIHARRRGNQAVPASANRRSNLGASATTRRPPAWPTWSAKATRARRADESQNGTSEKSSTRWQSSGTSKANVASWKAAALAWLISPVTPTVTTSGRRSRSWTSTATHYAGGGEPVLTPSRSTGNLIPRQALHG